MLALAVTVSDYWRYVTEVDANAIRSLAGSNIGLALVVCFVSGMLTSLTPCVYPMIPITVSIFGRAAQRESRMGWLGFDFHSFWLACIYVAGMCTTYSLMGVVAGMTGRVFGSVLQSAWMLAFLCLLFLTLSFGQLGLFKIQLPVSIQSRLAGTGRATSSLGIFLMGLVSGLIVSPCVGPVIAGVLAFVFDTSSALRGMLYFLSFSLGLGVLFLLIGGFSGLVNRIPRSGPWMTRVNIVLAGLLLVAAGYYGFLWAKRVGILASAPRTSALVWLSDESQAVTLAKNEQKILIIDFTANWCEACHVIDEEVFHDKAVGERLAALVLLRLDLTESTPQNESMTRKYGVMGLPAILFVHPDGQVASPRITGTISAEEFLGILSKVLAR